MIFVLSFYEGLGREEKEEKEEKNTGDMATYYIYHSLNLWIGHCFPVDPSPTPSPLSFATPIKQTLPLSSQYF